MGRGEWPSKGQGKKPGKEARPERAQVAFPSYEAMAVPNHKGGKAVGKQQNKMALETEPELVGATGDLARYVQKLVNTLRRSDGKLRRCEMDKEEAQAKWDEYQKHLKQSFIQERQRYREKLDKVQAEQEEYIKAKNGALQELQEIIADPHAADTTETNYTWQRGGLGGMGGAHGSDQRPLGGPAGPPGRGGYEWPGVCKLRPGSSCWELSTWRRRSRRWPKPHREGHTNRHLCRLPRPSGRQRQRTTEEAMVETYSGSRQASWQRPPTRTSPSTSRAPMPTIRSRSPVPTTLGHGSL